MYSHWYLGGHILPIERLRECHIAILLDITAPDRGLRLFFLVGALDVLVRQTELLRGPGFEQAHFVIVWMLETGS